VNRITPRWLYLGMAVSLGTSTLAYFLFPSGTSNWISLAAKEAAYALAAFLCLEIAGEYRYQRTLRLSWLLLAANALVSMARHVLEFNLLEYVPNIHLYQQIAITLALLLLLGGMWTMARAFLRTGLGFRIDRIDVVAVAGTFGLLSVILVFHNHLSEASEPLLATRVLQIFSQVIIAIAGAFAVVLHRIILEMGGGKLAIAMRFLVAHILGRVLLVLVNLTIRPLFPVHPGWEFASHLCFDAMTWIFALAACYRANMFADALQQAPPRPEEILALSLEERWTRI
jgi:hypothetical protein